MKNGTTYQTTGVTGLIDGIMSTGGTNTITNNTVRDLTIGNGNSTALYLASVIGIGLNSTTAVTQTISGNTIYNLSNTLAAFTGNVIGLYYSGSTTPGTVSKNFIYGLSVTGATSTAASIYGIKINAGATTYSNNIISHSGSTKTNIYGIYETGAASNDNSLYFNTVYIGGSVASGATNKSYALYSAVTTNTRIFQNNIFYNARSTVSGASLHYAMYILAAGGTLTCDYNDYYTSGTGGKLGYYGADQTGLPIVTGGDVNSFNINPSFVNAGGTAAVDYKPGVTTLTGVTGTGITTDYSGVTRTASPTMGAFEYIPLNVLVEIGVPTKFNLGQNYPNPFNPTTNVKFSISNVQFVTLKVFDMLGKEIAILVNEKLDAGEHNIKWNASEYPSGVYSYQLTAGNFRETKRMILIK